MKYLKIKTIVVAIFLVMVVFTQITIFSAPPLADIPGAKVSILPNQGFVCQCPMYFAIDCYCQIYR